MRPFHVLSIAGLRKDRVQSGTSVYSLHVPQLEIGAGDKIAISGPSGIGKSTLLDMLGMTLRPDAVERFVFAAPQGDAPALGGGVLAHDVHAAWVNNELEEITSWRRNIGYILQTGALLPFFTIRENILTQAELKGCPPDERFFQRLVQVLGIEHLLEKRPGQLSVGERQRAAIARAVAPLPPLILADEPTAALDPKNAMKVLALLSHLVEKLRITLVLVTHAPDQVLDMNFRYMNIRMEPARNDAQNRELAVLREGRV